MGNREKVWKAEEREKEDQKKLEELRRELQEERELEDMRRQRDAARGVERYAIGEWMAIYCPMDDVRGVGNW